MVDVKGIITHTIKIPDADYIYYIAIQCKDRLYCTDDCELVCCSALGEVKWKFTNDKIIGLGQLQQIKMTTSTSVVVIHTMYQLYHLTDSDVKNS